MILYVTHIIVYKQVYMKTYYLEKSNTKNEIIPPPPEVGTVGQKKVERGDATITDQIKFPPFL